MFFFDRRKSVSFFHFDQVEGQEQIEQFLGIGEIGLQYVPDLVQPVQERTPMDEQCFGSPGNALMQLQVAAGSLVQFRMVGLIFVLQFQKPFMTDHVGRQ